MTQLFLFIHILCAILWIGAMMFFTFVMVPFIRSEGDKPEHRLVMLALARRTRPLGWGAVVLLLITGPLVLNGMGVSPMNIFDPSFHTTEYGKTLMMKLTFIFLIVASSLTHDFWFGPRAREDENMRKYAKFWGRSNFIMALVIVFFAVSLRLGS